MSGNGVELRFRLWIIGQNRHACAIQPMNQGVVAVVIVLFFFRGDLQALGKIVHLYGLVRLAVNRPMHLSQLGRRTNQILNRRSRPMQKNCARYSIENMAGSSVVLEIG